MFKMRLKENQQFSGLFKLFIIVWAFMENGLFSGLRAGWPALVYILKQEQIYANLCSTKSIGEFVTIPANNTKEFIHENISNCLNQSASRFTDISCNGSFNLANGCDEQDAVFNQCFTVATAAMALFALIFGHLNYRFGIRVPRILSVCLFVAGAFCFAFVDTDSPWLVFPGLLLISSGGMALYITNNQLSYMFTTGSAAVVGLLCGALEASSTVQTVIKVLYEHGIKLNIIYSVLAALYCLTLISTFCFMPRDFIKHPKSVVCSADNTHQILVKYVDKEQSHSEQITASRLNERCNISTLYQNDASAHKNFRTHEAKENIGEFDGTDNDQARQETLFQITSEDKYLPITQKNSVSFTNRSETCQNPIIDVGSSRNSKSSIKTEFTQHTISQGCKKEIIALTTVAHDQSETVRAEVDSSEATSRSRFESSNDQQKTLVQCLLSKTFLLYLFWAVTMQIILSMCLGTFNPWLVYVTDRDSVKVSKLTDVFFYTMLGSPVLSMSNGLIMDAMKRGKRHDDAADKRTLQAAAISLGVTSGLGVLVSVFFLICDSDVIVAAIITLVVFRTGLYSCGTAFLRIMYPTNHFGILCGVMSMFAGGLSFLQYPLFLWIQHRNNAWKEVFGFLAITGLLSLAQPAYLYWRSRKRRRAVILQ